MFRKLWDFDILPWPTAQVYQSNPTFLEMLGLKMTSVFNPYP